MKRPLLLVAILTWSVLAWMFVFAFSGVHVCGILRPAADGALTQADMDRQVADCNRPDVGAITVFSVGYVVLAGVAIGKIREARRDP